MHYRPLEVSGCLFLFFSFFPPPLFRFQTFKGKDAGGARVAWWPPRLRCGSRGLPAEAQAATVEELSVSTSLVQPASKVSPAARQRLVIQTVSVIFYIQIEIRSGVCYFGHGIQQCMETA